MSTGAIQQALLLVVPMLAAIILHEISHGIVAYWRGDPTAKEAGRLTLNPLPHIDPFGSVVLPALLYFSNAPFLFGWAKPVPVDIGRLHRPKRDMVLVAVAGPLTNIVLAMISAAVLKAISAPLDPLYYLQTDTPRPAGFEVAFTSVLLNIGLAVFNLIPILPLDGGRVLTGLLPMPLARVFARTERFGMLVVMVLAATNVLGVITRPLRWFLLTALL